MTKTSVEKEKKLDEKIQKELEKEEEKDESRRRYFIFTLIFLILLFFSTFGITVSFYKGTPGDDNTIVTDKIIFTYSDVDKGGNGINIKNATPLSDTLGKVQIGNGKYFDFSVTATSKKSNIHYKLLVKKDPASTLNGRQVRIYLTSLNGNYEKFVTLTTFNYLRRETINGDDYYVLYEKTLHKGIDNYSDYYRLRMWVKEDATDYEDKMFALKVDVVAEQVGE